MVWGCMSVAGTGELQFIQGTMNANIYCDILKQIMIPSFRRQSCRAVFLDLVMEEWKRTPLVICEALVNSMPKRVKAVLENNGGHTKY